MWVSLSRTTILVLKVGRGFVGAPVCAGESSRTPVARAIFEYSSTKFTDLHTHVRETIRFEDCAATKLCHASGARTYVITILVNLEAAIGKPETRGGRDDARDDGRLDPSALRGRRGPGPPRGRRRRRLDRGESVIKR
jgi:hypothetical protein